MNPPSHLSRYALDRVIGETTPPGAEAHLAECADCSARLEERRRLLSAVAATSDFARGRARLLAATPPVAARPRRLWPLGVLATAAAALLLALAWPPGPEGETPSTFAEPGDGLRAKGSFALTVVRSADGRSEGPFPAGAEVELRVGGWQAAALVLALDGEGRASVIWPPGGTRSGRITPDGRLEPRFRVTPGDLLLLSIFSASPIDAERARRELEEATRRCGAGPDPACSAPPPQPGELGRAWTTLRTEGRP